MFGDLRDLDALQICAKGKSISEFFSVSKGIRNMQKIVTEPKITKEFSLSLSLFSIRLYSEKKSD